jgi:hypothetical protein
MTDCQDDAVIGDNCVGIKLRLKLFEYLGSLRAAESVSGMVVKEH